MTVEEELRNSGLSKSVFELSLSELVALELPHIEYVIETLRSQQLSPGTLPEIVMNLRAKLIQESRPTN